MKDRTARITGISIVAITGLLIAATAAWRVLRYSERHIDIDRSQYPVMGLDISSHNGLPDFDSIAAAGVRFVFLKASEGETFRDPAFLRNYVAPEYLSAHIISSVSTATDGCRPRTCSPPHRTAASNFRSPSTSKKPAIRRRSLPNLS